MFSDTYRIGWQAALIATLILILLLFIVTLIRISLNEDHVIFRKITITIFQILAVAIFIGTLVTIALFRQAIIHKIQEESLARQLPVEKEIIPEVIEK